MAKNWMLKEVMAVVNNGEKEDIQDIGKRFPLTASLLFQLKGFMAVEELLNNMPDYVTMGKMEKALKDGVADSDDSDDTDAKEEKEEKTPAKSTEKKVEKKEEVKKSAGGKKPTKAELEAMPSSKLYKLCGEAGMAPRPKTKEDQLAAMLKYYGYVDDDSADDEDDVEENPYADMTAQEMFKLCKERGIKAEIKKPAKYYEELLIADDEANADDADDDDWGEDEEEEKTPAKGKDKAKGKAKPKEDDDDWDV